MCNPRGHLITSQKSLLSLQQGLLFLLKFRKPLINLENRRDGKE
jgi:hypothetical protein